jgi:hypothetical protein
MQLETSPHSRPQTSERGADPQHRQNAKAPTRNGAPRCVQRSCEPGYAGNDAAGDVGSTNVAVYARSFSANRREKLKGTQQKRQRRNEHVRQCTCGKSADDRANPSVDERPEAVEHRHESLRPQCYTDGSHGHEDKPRPCRARLHVLEGAIRAATGTSAETALSDAGYGFLLANWSIVHGFAHLALGGELRDAKGNATGVETVLQSVLPLMLQHLPVL